MLTVELSNFPRSRINGAGFQTRVRSFRSFYTGKSQGVLHWISESSARQNVSAGFFFRVNIGAVSEAGLIANLASPLNILFL